MEETFLILRSLFYVSKRYLKCRSKDKTPTTSDEGLLFWWAHQDLNLDLGVAIVGSTLADYIRGAANDPKRTPSCLDIYSLFLENWTVLR